MCFVTLTSINNVGTELAAIHTYLCTCACTYVTGLNLLWTAQHRKHSNNTSKEGLYVSKSDNITTMLYHSSGYTAHPK